MQCNTYPIGEGSLCIRDQIPPCLVAPSFLFVPDDLTWAFVHSLTFLILFLFILLLTTLVTVPLPAGGINTLIHTHIL